MDWTRPGSARPGTLGLPAERGAVPTSPQGGSRVFALKEAQAHRVHVTATASLPPPTVAWRCRLVTRPEAPPTALLAAGQNYNDIKVRLVATEYCGKPHILSNSPEVVKVWVESPAGRQGSDQPPGTTPR